MPNITYFTDHAGTCENIKGVKQNATNFIDFTKQAVAAADTVRLLTIPAGSIVRNVNVVTVTAAGATCTMNIGDGSTADLFDAAVNLNTTGTMSGTSGTESTLIAAGGKYYATEGYIVGTMAHSNAAAQFYISAEFVIINKAHA